MTVLDLPVQSVPPVLNLGGIGGNFSATFVKGGGGVPIVSTSTLAVTDATNLTSATVTISNPPNGSSEVIAVSAAALTGSGVTATPGTGSLTLSGTATAAVYQSILRTVTYNDTATSPSLTARTISFTLTDENSFSSTPVTTTVTFDVAPTIVGVYASGTTWSSSFLNVLDAAGLASSSATHVGFRLADGSNQLTTDLPWSNVDTLSIAFNKNVNVTQSSLTLYDSSNHAYTPAGFSYNAVTFIAVWQFAVAWRRTSGISAWPRPR